MKRIICCILAAVFSICLLSGCNNIPDPTKTPYKEPPAIGFATADQFTGYKLGTVADLVSEKTITEIIDSPEVYAYPSVESGLEDLRSNKIHGMVLPAVYANNELEKNTDFAKTYLPFIDKQLRAISMSTFEFVLPVDAALTTINNNGTAQKIANSHSPYADTADAYTRPADYEKIEGRTITIGICSDDVFPYNYRDSAGKLTGINVDIAHEIAAGIHAELIIKEYTEDKLMSALDSGEVDIIMSQFHEDEMNPISTEYLYSHNYCDASTYILVNSSMVYYEGKEITITQ